MSEYTSQEKVILGHLSDAAVTFAGIPRQHPSEAEEFYAAIHAAQTLIMARFAQRHETSGMTPVKPRPHTAPL